MMKFTGGQQAPVLLTTWAAAISSGTDQGDKTCCLLNLRIYRVTIKSLSLSTFLSIYKICSSGEQNVLLHMCAFRHSSACDFRGRDEKRGRISEALFYSDFGLCKDLKLF